MENLTFLFNVAKVALGLGFVIFIHELGHFLLAKWNGVKVERFSIGFFRPIASYRRGVGLRIGTGSRPPGPDDPPTYGETEYVLAILPLGGYVKMLGEAEDPAENVEKSSDPRAFNNKPVGARMAIITAGVIMNVVLGFLCFAYVHSQPGMDIEARVGGVLPGSPADQAGLRAGDEIVAVDGKRDLTFPQFKQEINLSGAGQKLQIRVKRPGEADERSMEIEPKRADGAGTPAIGFFYARSLKLVPTLPFSPLPGQEASQAGKFGGFEPGDVVAAVGPEGGPLEPVTSHLELVRQLDRLRAAPLVVEVERQPAGADAAKQAERVRVVVPPHRFLEYGIRLASGPITSVRPDSPAARAGLKVGDRIVGAPDPADFDPMKLPDLARDRAGSPLELLVRRAGAAEGAAPEAVTVTPDSTPPWVDQLPQPGQVTPLEVSGLGAAMLVGPKIVAVAPGTSAARGGLKAGDSIKSVVVVPEKTEKVSGKTLTFTSDESGVAWPAAFGFAQDNPVKTLTVVINGGTPVELKPEVATDRFNAERGLNFEPALKEIPAAPLGLAIRRGAEETWDNIAGIFKMFRSLAQRRIGGENFGGVILITQIAYTTASAGITPLVHFLGALSISLAVLNFLPIPPLDGGQFLFMAAEKIRGKPLPDAALAAGTYAGIAFVLVLIVVVNVKDVVMLVQSYF